VAGVMGGGGLKKKGGVSTRSAPGEVLPKKGKETRVYAAGSSKKFRGKKTDVPKRNVGLGRTDFTRGLKMLGGKGEGGFIQGEACLGEWGGGCWGLS